MHMEADNYWQKIRETADYLWRRTDKTPAVGLMTGTGLGESIGSLDIDFAIDYADIPNFPVSTVQSHSGRLVAGDLGGRRILAMQGRFHLYEGYAPRMVAFPVRVMQALGVKTLIVTNAAGGLNLSFSPGDIMVIDDHINFSGENPLVGPNNDDWGIRFPDMAEVYSKKLKELVFRVAEKQATPIQKGIYAGLKGPSLETPAETRFLRQVGADAVGLSTIQEVIAAVHAEMAILGLSIITNVNDPDQQAPATVEEIIEVAQKAAPALANLITRVIKEL